LFEVQKACCAASWKSTDSGSVFDSSDTLMGQNASTFDEVHSIKCEMAAEVLRTSGLLRLKVTGWSMLPTVRPGDTLIVERAGRSALVQGDIVLVSRNRRLFAHRLVSKDVETAGFLTRGDAMTAADPPVGDNQVLGRISFILRNGRCIEPSRTLSLQDRMVANLARRSEIAARIIVGIHNLRQTTPNQTT
jgi:hypothetical protein